MRKLAMLTTALCAIGFAASAQAQQAAPAPTEPKDMTREDLEAEVTSLRPIVANGGVKVLRPTACDAAENRQFDFWLGEWDVSGTGADTVIVAESSITLASQGCVLIENWRPFQGPSGYSLNMYDAKTKQWHQEWMDGSGRHTPFKGVVEADGVLRYEQLDGPWPNKDVKRKRMNFQKVDADTVRQWGENYSAKKKEWSVAWDLTYQRRPGTK